MAIKWYGITIEYGGKKRQYRVRIPARTLKLACQVLYEIAQEGRLTTYREVMERLWELGAEKVSYETIGFIVGEVSMRVGEIYGVYPSAIVVRKDTGEVGEGFWGINKGVDKPCDVPKRERKKKLKEYQRRVFETKGWGCL